jgi:hypothetical protein
MTGALFADRPFSPTVTDGDHAPRAPRTNLLLSATVETSAGGAPVRVRNLSGDGAMLEGDHLPETGERLVLRRAVLTVAGACVWRSGNRCGVRFDRSISVQQWAASVRAAANAGQQRIDAIQATLRAGGPLASADPVVTPARAAVVDNVADEVAAAARFLRGLSDRLADDMAVIVAHGEVLQQLDPLAQTLDHLARVLTATDPGPVIDAIGMDDLRTRLTRKPSQA